MITCKGYTRAKLGNIPPERIFFFKPKRKKGNIMREKDGLGKRGENCLSPWDLCSERLLFVLILVCTFSAFLSVGTLCNP